MKKKRKRKTSKKAKVDYFLDAGRCFVKIKVCRPIGPKHNPRLFGGNVPKVQPKGIEYFRLTPPEPKEPKRKKTSHQLDLEEVRLEKAVKRAEATQWLVASGKSKVSGQKARSNYEKALEKLEAFRKRRV